MRVCDASSEKNKKIKLLDAEEVPIPVEKAVAQQEIQRQIVANDSNIEGASGAKVNHPEVSAGTQAEEEIEKNEEGVQKKRKVIKLYLRDASFKERKKTGTQAEDEIEETEEGLQKKRKVIKLRVPSYKKNKKIKLLDAEEVLIPVEKAVAQQEIPRRIVANDSHTDGASGAEANHLEVGAVSNMLETQKRQSDETINLDDAFGDLDNDSKFADVQYGSHHVIPNRDVTNEVPPRREFLENVIIPGKAQKIANIKNIELADKLKDLGGESLCFVLEGASSICKLTEDIDLYRERLGKMENKATKDASTIEQQAKTIGELTKLLTTSMENAREVRQKLEGEALESAAKLKELANELKGHATRNAKVASDISDRDKVIAEKEKEIEGLKQKLVADETKDKEIAHLKEQLGDAIERGNKLIKTQEVLKESAAKLKELANVLNGCMSGNAKVASEISDRDKVIAEKEKKIEGLQQKLVADETKDKEIAHLKEQLRDATERENKLIKTQEALKKENSQSVRSKDAALSSRRLVLSEVVPHVVKKLHRSHEFNAPLSKVKKLAILLGRQQVIQEIQETKFPNIRLDDMEGYDREIIGKFEEACKQLEEADFPYIKEISENTGRTVDDILKVEPKGPQSTHSEHA